MSVFLFPVLFFGSKKSKKHDKRVVCEYCGRKIKRSAASVQLDGYYCDDSCYDAMSDPSVQESLVQEGVYGDGPKAPDGAPKSKVEPNTELVKPVEDLPCAQCRKTIFAGQPALRDIATQLTFCHADCIFAFAKEEAKRQAQARETSFPTVYHENKEILAALKTLAQFTYDSDEEVIIVSRQAGYKFGVSWGTNEAVYKGLTGFTHFAPHDPLAGSPVPGLDAVAVQWWQVPGDTGYFYRAEVPTPHGAVQISQNERSQKPLDDSLCTELRCYFQGRRYRREIPQGPHMNRETIISHARDWIDAIATGSPEVGEEY